MTQNLMLLATVCMGITVMFLSSAIAVRFAMTGKVLARAFVYNLFGEFCACAGTTYFAVHQLMGTIDNVTEAWATFIRWGMFLTMLASSIHMAFVIRKIEAGKL